MNPTKIIFGVVFLFSALFFYSFFTIEDNVGETIPCYDRYGNEIVGLDCIREPVFDNGERVMFLSIGILFLISGLVILLWGILER